VNSPAESSPERAELVELRAQIALLARALAEQGQQLEQLRSRLRSGQHGLGWDSVRWVDLDDVARVFGVRARTVANWCRTGRIPATKYPSRSRRFRRWLVPAFWLMGLPEIVTLRERTARETRNSAVAVAHRYTATRSPHEIAKRLSRVDGYARIDAWRVANRSRVARDEGLPGPVAGATTQDDAGAAQQVRGA